jgi:hypothetical protein
MKTAIATTFAAAMLAASSFAFAADNSGNNNDGNKDMDNKATGSINNNDGNNVSIEDREFCQANPADAKCQNLGGEMNQQ